MRKVQGGLIMDGITKAKRRRMRSALERILFDLEKLSEAALKQYGGLNPNQMARYRRMNEESQNLMRKIGEQEL